MTDKERKHEGEMPAEVQTAVRAIDLHAVCSELGAALSLTSEQRADLEHGLTSFLNAVWSDKHAPLDLGSSLPAPEKEKQSLLRAINEKVFLKIIQALDQQGLNDRQALFESGKMRLTACKLYDGKYSAHETDRIILKKTELLPRRFLSGKNRVKIDLEADYPDKGRWGDYAPIRISLPSEKQAAVFLGQLNKAVAVGNFICFQRIFSRFQSGS